MRKNREFRRYWKTQEILDIQEILGIQEIQGIQETLENTKNTVNTEALFCNWKLS